MTIVVRGGKTMSGTCEIKTAKNSVLPILACSVLCDGEMRLHNCPDIADIHSMLEILRGMGAKAEFKGGTVAVDCRTVNCTTVAGEATAAIRSSIFLLGPILSRFRRAAVSLPGGCAIGKRPIDLHLDGLRALGVMVDEDDSIVYCDGAGLRAGEYRLRFASVGATENLIMAVALTSGRTVISNAAREPEVVDLADFINAMGGRVSGAGTDKVIVEGVERLSGGDYTPIPDRIVAGTYMIACAMCGGKIKLAGADIGHLRALERVLYKAGVKVTAKNTPSRFAHFRRQTPMLFAAASSSKFLEGNYIEVESSKRLCRIGRIETGIYPEFATDLQAQITAMLAVSAGESVVVENLFETRFKHIDELRKMGADISVDGKQAVIRGVPRLSGAQVMCHDLRGGAALVLAGLCADGVTTVNDARHIMRGYEDIVGDLRKLGCDCYIE